MSQHPKKRISVIVKPTHDCNLACTYCYVDPNAEIGRMSEPTLWNMTSKVLEIHDSVRFIWHGGEPLLMPLSFYERAVEFQQKHHDGQVENGFQTNGTLVTDDVLDFCERYGFDIGFSLDGPREMNDRTRHTRTGESVFDRILGAIHKAKQRKQGGGTIVVVNKLNKSGLGGIYEFAKSEGINLKLNPLIKAGRTLSMYGDLGLGPQEYGSAMIDLFDVWFYDKPAIKLDPFDDMIASLLTNKAFGCNYSESCQSSFISIGPQGDIYPCGRFDGNGEFYLGNINTDDLTEVLTSERREWLRRRIERVEECQPCEYRQICNSGCMHNAYMQTGNIDTRDYYCASYKILFSHIQKRVEAELAKAEVRQDVV